MSVRKVVVSGTKGVGSGTRPAETCLCSRRQGAQMYVGWEEKRDSKVRDFRVIMIDGCREGCANRASRYVVRIFVLSI